jgi:hypothetical protein
MMSKELAVELRDRIVSKHRSGEGNKTMSAAFELFGLNAKHQVRRKPGTIAGEAW